MSPAAPWALNGRGLPWARVQVDATTPFEKSLGHVARGCWDFETLTFGLMGFPYSATKSETFSRGANSNRDYVAKDRGGLPPWIQLKVKELGLRRIQSLVPSPNAKLWLSKPMGSHFGW